MRIKGQLANQSSPGMWPLNSSYVLLCVQPYKFHKLEADIATNLTVTKEDAVKYYTQMKMIRTMETAAGNLYKEKAVRGFCHLYSGQVIHIGLCSFKYSVHSFMLFSVGSCINFHLIIIIIITCS